ncbi:MAG: ABC transporter permease [Turicibacter sp.]|jgi:iron complex transport system permease protein|uniref:Iron ABC transporter permease n=1 Tax=Turicibacter faecis TaxID=2963365 RepID=A0ABM8IR34_9FIRM|nr:MULTISPECIES: ABC transporter permease [unclassified Turicibacter]MBC9719888.1 ABC transporter permease [Lactobacillus sp.]MCI8702364.1 ABC transporter permease [Turicibacter sp.]BEH91879.1 iron ABC transporter permease [Turicibacter sp. TC023]MCU7205391.1 ABC transporter permease [Turicibacter sp. TA25]MCU7209290.1 ABC transporter permease [Turicibacter sp. 1E2]
MRKRYLIILLGVLSVISVFIGASDVTLSSILNGDSQQLYILFISRIPRLLSVCVTGVGMGICGLIMQQLTRNKFVSPTTAATMDFAKLGMLIAMVFFAGASLVHKMVFAFICSLLGTFLFMGIMKQVKFRNSLFIPLIGMMLGNVVNSITSFIAYQFDLVQNISSWAQGDFTNIMKGNYELLYLSIPLVFIAFLYANKFTIAGMGEDFSANLGLNHKWVVNVGLTIIALITSVIIITVGSIPFIGLIVPNVVSMYLGDNLKRGLWHTALMGALFLLACDVIGRIVIYPYEVSIGLTVGVIGSIIFLYMLMRRGSNASA